jgi:hypothetical protein
MAQMALQAVENSLAFKTLAFIGAIKDVVRAHQSLIRKRHFGTSATAVWIKYGAMRSSLEKEDFLARISQTTFRVTVTVCLTLF